MDGTELNQQGKCNAIDRKSTFITFFSRYNSIVIATVEELLHVERTDQEIYRS